mmetsp:Transcript_79090/g.155172  ORF Transcript_79090/g.155172 Transcript_79090/m.155172 type:complete len:208 (+) Transcript_79090:189-812(+)
MVQGLSAAAPPAAAAETATGAASAATAPLAPLCATQSLVGRIGALVVDQVVRAMAITVVHQSYRERLEFFQPPVGRRSCRRLVRRFVFGLRVVGVESTWTQARDCGGTEWRNLRQCLLHHRGCAHWCPSTCCPEHWPIPSIAGSSSSSSGMDRQQWVCKDWYPWGFFSILCSRQCRASVEMPALEKCHYCHILQWHRKALCGQFMAS